MRPDLSYRSQAGFGLVAAIFVMLIVAGAIAAMMQLATTQHGTVVLALQQARAYQAAKAGVEWGIGAVETTGCSNFSAQKKEFPNLSGFNVEISCTNETILVPEEESGSVTIYEITSTAEYGASGSPDYAYRRLTAVIESE
ncbi:hypothetical protein HW090_04230 [Pseudomonas sp. ABC1]|uniref:hypothetical protein n=1 Tax=Pseudomonas sp. ABC1 TaxID=2748080 RepID=UPI0015C31E11|nr:hypothetical protein [Pseudomonas sp. ABC1]QLF92446.1 hypothetical protein HW090_04230 [Pseudomonas sp. ABC1]